MSYRSIGHPARQCAICGTEFIPNSGTHKYCSTDCMSRGVSPKRGEYLIYERDNFQCAFCGASPMVDGVKLCVDHIIPMMGGGKSVAGNLVTSCKRCNGQKSGYRMPIEAEEFILAQVSERNKRIGWFDSQPFALSSESGRGYQGEAWIRTADRETANSDEAA